MLYIRMIISAKHYIIYTKQSLYRNCARERKNKPIKAESSPRERCARKRKNREQSAIRFPARAINNSIKCVQYTSSGAEQSRAAAAAVFRVRCGDGYNYYNTETLCPPACLPRITSIIGIFHCRYS